MNEIRTTRFSGADWADQLHPIMVIGAGGISSWTILNLARIGHELFIIDPDTVDETNVTGGQMYRQIDINKPKVIAVEEICRQFGCINSITPVQDYFTEESGMTDICICGLDNMAARKLAFKVWCDHVQEKTAEEASKCLFIDGRLTLEMWEVFTLRGDSPVEDFDKYVKEYLFDDSEANAVDCTTKQSTFGAMGISSYITGTLCNWVTNLKNGFDIREVPFYHRVHLPMMQDKHSNQVEQVMVEERIVEKEIMVVGSGEAYEGELERLRNFYNVVGSLHGVVKKPVVERKEVHIQAHIPENIKQEVWQQL